jgi:hypothetical protein
VHCSWRINDTVALKKTSNSLRPMCLCTDIVMHISPKIYIFVINYLNFIDIIFQQEFIFKKMYMSKHEHCYYKTGTKNKNKSFSAFDHCKIVMQNIIKFSLFYIFKLQINACQILLSQIEHKLLCTMLHLKNSCYNIIRVATVLYSEKMEAL